MPSTTDRQPLIPIAEQRLARSALSRLLSQLAESKGRLLYLVGPAGCGKSALLTESFGELPSSQVPPHQPPEPEVIGQTGKSFTRKVPATGSDVRTRREPDSRTFRLFPPAKTVNLTAAEFAAQLADASTKQQVPNFQEGFRNVSVLVCEDIQSIEGRPETLNQLLAAIDDLLAGGSDVIVTSTKLPGQLDSFPPKLVSRFRGGTVIAIKPPGLESRTSLLQLFCRQRQISISREALGLLAESLAVSPRELIGVVTQLSELRRSFKRSDVEAFLRDTLPTKQITPLTVARAVAIGAALTGFAAVAAPPDLPEGYISGVVMTLDAGQAARH